MPGPGLPPEREVEIVVDGQSLAIVPVTAGGGESYWRNLGYQLGVPVQSVAIGGTGWDVLLAGNGSDIAPAVDRWTDAWEACPADRHGLVMFGGQTNLGLGSGSAIFDLAVDYADAAYSFGFDFVVCLTIPEVSAFWGGPWEPQRSDFNDLLLDDGGVNFDAAVDLDPVVSLTSTPRLYLDGLHMRGRGNEAVAAATVPVVTPLL